MFSGAALQLAGQTPAIPQILVQPPGKQPQGMAVPKLSSRAKPFVERSADRNVEEIRGDQRWI
jgi:hypothetical protein